MSDKLGDQRQAESTAAGVVPNDLMEPVPNVQRIMWTGTIWFAGVVLSIGATMGPLLASGWRPDQLPGVLQGIWWIGVVIMTLAVGLIGWSGCPILEVSVKVASNNKSRTMQFGTALFISSGAILLAAIMLG